jgi:hypothetical protein
VVVCTSGYGRLVYLSFTPIRKKSLRISVLELQQVSMFVSQRKDLIDYEIFIR